MGEYAKHESAQRHTENMQVPDLYPSKILHQRTKKDNDELLA